MAELAVRPTFETWVASYGRSQRSITGFNRARAAYEVAALKDPNPTTYDVGVAYSLLQRCIRFALADQRMDETETEANWDSPSRKRKAAQLEARLNHLNEELRAYGCVLYRPWCCYDVFRRDESKPGICVMGTGYLYFY